MKSEIRRLEELSRLLEPDTNARSRLFERVIEYANVFLEQLPYSPAYIERPDMGRALYDSPIKDNAEDIEEVLEVLRWNVDTVGINSASPRMLGYIPGGGLFHSALGDFLAAIANRYAGHVDSSPGAVRMENYLLRWMGSLVGYPRSAAGNLTSGGSLANLNAIVTARDSRDVSGNLIEKSVVYLTDHAHHSIDRSLHVAGLDRCLKRRISVDDGYRVNADMFLTAVKDDTAAGLHPWLVVASAGTTNSGSVDPLVPIGDIAREYGLWFHVDGAYGAFFALCDEGRAVLEGMDRSDSIIMDPHKTLFLPYGSGAVLVRDGKLLFESYHWRADYAQDVSDDSEEFSPCDLSPELTKHFRGLRLWLPLKLVGVAAFRAALKEKILLARHFYQKIEEMDGFETGPFPDLSIVTYRYMPTRGSPDEFNRRLVENIRREGRILISSTRLNGNFVLRMAAVSFRTHLDDIDETLEILRHTAHRLQDDE